MNATQSIQVEASIYRLKKGPIISGYFDKYRCYILDMFIQYFIDIIIFMINVQYTDIFHVEVLIYYYFS